MSYADKKRNELFELLTIAKSKNKTMEGTDGIFYTRDEMNMKIARVQRQIDGFERVARNKNIRIWDNKNAVFEALATKEFDYFLEVENYVDSFTSTKVLSKMTTESYEKIFNLVKNLNMKIAKRSSVEFRNNWIQDRKYELASTGEFDEDFNLIPESVNSMNCLDLIMSGKMSKDELVKANLWKDFHNVSTIDRDVIPLASMIAQYRQKNKNTTNA